MRKDDDTTNQGGEQLPWEGANTTSEGAANAAILTSAIDKANRKIIRRKKLGEPPRVDALAMSILRQWAFANGLSVASPARLIGRQYTGEGDSDDLVEGRQSYSLVNKELLFDGLYIDEKSKKRLSDVADALLEFPELDVKDCRCMSSSDTGPAQQKDERDRWPLKDEKGHTVAWVVRVGQDKTKRYLTYLWWGHWYLITGPLPYNLPLANLSAIGETELPVAIHEGLKAAAGALATAKHPFLATATHSGWQGGKDGIPSTDWLPLAGRKIVLVPDMDTASNTTMDVLAKHLAKLGEPVRRIVWPHSLRRKHRAWDFADTLFDGFPTLSQMNEWTKVVESPIDHRGFVLPSFAARTAYNPRERVLYTLGLDYEPLSREGFNLKFSRGERNLFRDIVQAPGVQEVRGAVYVPSEQYGDIINGRVNIAQPSPRAHIQPSPLEVVLTLKELASLRFWLKAMVPDPAQRRLLIDRAAWALSHPGEVPRYMVVIQGDSSLGKSLFFDLLCAVVGERDAAAIFPKDAFSNFNSLMSNKRVVCLHEIHSNDITLKQNGERLKDLIANSTLTVNEKYVKEESRPNITHWFAATNEKKPFELAHGNDRFYFCQGGRPLSNAFFEKWVPRWLSADFLDRLYAAALAWVPEFNMRGRAPEQEEIWGELTKRSQAVWKQKVVGLLESLEKPASDHPPCFMDTHLLDLIEKRHPNIGPEDIRAFMRDQGYEAVRRRKPNGERRGWLWAKTEDVSALRRYKSALDVSTFGGGGDLSGE